MDSARPALDHAGVATVRATHVRWWILSIVMVIMAVTALNRLNLSIAGKPIEEEFNFSTVNMGLVFSAFLWGYALFQFRGDISATVSARGAL